MSDQAAAPNTAPTPAPAAATPPPAAKPAAAKPANDNGAPPAEQAAPTPPPAPVEHEIKIGKQTRKVTDAEVRQALGMAADEPVGPREVRALQLEVASRQRFREAAEREKQLAEREQMLDKDFVRAVADKHFGGDRIKAREHLIKMLGGEIAEETLPPEERAERQRRRELEEKAKKLDEYEKAEQQRAYQTQVERQTQQAGRAFAEALKRAGAPTTPHAIGRMAAIAESALAGEIEVESVDDLAAIVLQEMQAEVESRFDALSDDDLMALLDRKGRMAKLRAIDAKRIKGELVQRAASANSNGKARIEQPARAQTPDEYLRELRKSIK